MEKRTRKRGVKASRIKLEAALHKIGLKTQTALAHKIAELENLDTIPKDLVNRVFREENVSPNTLARIANALDAEPYTLYLSQQEFEQKEQFVNPVKTETINKTEPLNKNNYILPAIIFTTLLVIFIIGIFLFQPFSTSTNKEHKTPLLPLGQVSLLIDVDNALSKGLSRRIIQQLPSNIKAITINQNLLSKQDRSFDIAQEFQSDSVLTIRVSEVSRYIGLQYYLYYKNQERLIWTDVTTHTLLKQQSQKLASNVLNNLYFYLSLNGVDKAQLYPSILAQDNYLKARKLLDNQQSELNIKRAQTLLDNAITSFSDFVQVHVAMCESLIDESWSGNEKQKLEQANEHCQLALALKPNNNYALATSANLMRRSGRVDQAINQYHGILQHWPKNIDALSGISVTYLDAHRQNLIEFPDALTQATSFAQRAIDIEPDYWKHHFNLGTIQYFNGDSKAAIIAFTKASQLNPNELAYVNLGSMQLCQGQTQEALSSYQQAYHLAPNSYLGQEFLGQAYYQLANFEASQEFRSAAIKVMDSTNIGGIHQVWGNLGNSYRQLKQNDEAIEAYLNALKIIERDKLRGNITITDKIYQQFYSLILNKLSPTQYKFSLNLPDDLVLEELDASATVYLALIQRYSNQQEQVDKTLASLKQKCPGYVTFPDLQQALN